MLVEILQEPKNAILKQYKKLLAMDEVRLEFEDGALHSIAARAMERNTGARGLRAILEEYMLDIMYEIPKDDSIGQVIITKEYIDGNGGPRNPLKRAGSAVAGLRRQLVGAFLPQYLTYIHAANKRKGEMRYEKRLF